MESSGGKETAVKPSLREKLIRIGVESFVTVFFIGSLPFASGTAGTLVGCALWILFSNPWTHGIVLFIILFLGFFLSGYAERTIFKEKDSPKIVIDEVAGILITFLSFRFSHDLKGLILLCVGFLVFRFFDIAKPLIIKRVQRYRGGAGIMLDDVLSGVFSNAVLQIVRLIL